MIRVKKLLGRRVSWCHWERECRARPVVGERRDGRLIWKWSGGSWVYCGKVLLLEHLVDAALEAFGV